MTLAFDAINGPATVLYASLICPYCQRAMLAVLQQASDPIIELVAFRPVPDHVAAMSPLGKVPVLLWHQNTIAESVAIVEWLAEQPSSELMPADAFAKAHQRAWGITLTEYQVTLRTLFTSKDAETFRKTQLQIVSQAEHFLAHLSKHHLVSTSHGLLSYLGVMVLPWYLLLKTLDESANLGVISLCPGLDTMLDPLLEFSTVQWITKREYQTQLLEFITGFDSCYATRLRC